MPTAVMRTLTLTVFMLLALMVDVKCEDNIQSGIKSLRKKLEWKNQVNNNSIVNGTMKKDSFKAYSQILMIRNKSNNSSNFLNEVERDGIINHIRRKSNKEKHNLRKRIKKSTLNNHNADIIVAFYYIDSDKRNNCTTTNVSDCERIEKLSSFIETVTESLPSKVDSDLSSYCLFNRSVLCPKLYNVSIDSAEYFNLNNYNQSIISTSWNKLFNIFVNTDQSEPVVLRNLKEINSEILALINNLTSSNISVDFSDGEINSNTKVNNSERICDTDALKSFIIRNSTLKISEPYVSLSSARLIKLFNVIYNSYDSHSENPIEINSNFSKTVTRNNYPSVTGLNGTGYTIGLILSKENKHSNTFYSLESSIKKLGRQNLSSFKNETYKNLPVAHIKNNYFDSKETLRGIKLRVDLLRCENFSLLNFTDRKFNPAEYSRNSSSNLITAHPLNSNHIFSKLLPPYFLMNSQNLSHSSSNRSYLYEEKVYDNGSDYEVTVPENKQLYPNVHPPPLPPPPPPPVPTPSHNSLPSVPSVPVPHLPPEPPKRTTPVYHSTRRPEPPFPPPLNTHRPAIFAPTQITTDDAADDFTVLME